MTRLQNEKGASIVEFAQALPFLILVLGMSIDTGLFLAQNALLERSLSVAARHGAMQLEEGQCHLEAFNKFFETTNTYWFTKEALMSTGAFDAEVMVFPLSPSESFQVLSVRYRYEFNCFLCGVLPESFDLTVDKQFQYPTEHCQQVVGLPGQ